MMKKHNNLSASQRNKKLIEFKTYSELINLEISIENSPIQFNAESEKFVKEVRAKADEIK